MKLEMQLRFGNNIKSLRLHKSMNQTDMAKQLNVSRTTYAMYESGSRVPDMSTLIDIASFFGVKLDSLFYAETKDLLNDVLVYNSIAQTEQEILKMFSSLSDFSKGKLLERIYILYNEDALFLKSISCNSENNIEKTADSAAVK